MSTRNLDDVLYPVIFEDHDGTWTWSIESGKAYEPGHVIHARGDCCPDRRAATRFAKEAMAALAASARKSAPRPIQSAPSALQGWGVLQDNKVVAVFAKAKAARDFAKTLKNSAVRKVHCSFEWK